MLLATLLLATTAHAQQCELAVVGAHHLDIQACYDLAGDPPDDPVALKAWALPAVDRVLEGYHQRGYIAARAWARVRDEEAVIEVDEGEIHRVRILGVSTLASLTLLDNLQLEEGGVLYEPTLRASLEELKRNRGARSVDFVLEDGDDLVQNSWGLLVPERMLTVQVVTDEKRGFGVGVEVIPRWGVVTAVHWDGVRPEVDDHLSLELAISTPYQQWATEQEPRFRWVYGIARARYRAPGLGGGPLSPVIGAQSSVANWHRADIGLDSALVQDARGSFGASFRATPALRLELGTLVQAVDIYGNRQLTADLDGTSLVRGFATGRVSLQRDDGTLRTDLRDHLALDTRIGVGNDAHALALTSVEGQWVGDWRRHHVLVRTRETWLQGADRFFDELPVAGRYQRVFFADQYWTSLAAQVEVAGRIHIRRSFRLGLFHDLSVFADREEAGVVNVVNGLGPSVHLLLLDSFAADIYWGYGWSPDGASQNLSLSLKNVY